jgi:hypothetical protein
VIGEIGEFVGSGDPFHGMHRRALYFSISGVMPGFLF